MLPNALRDLWKLRNIIIVLLTPIFLLPIALEGSSVRLCYFFKLLFTGLKLFSAGIVHIRTGEITIGITDASGHLYIASSSITHTHRGMSFVYILTYVAK